MNNKAQPMERLWKLYGSGKNAATYLKVQTWRLKWAHALDSSYGGV